MDVLRLMMMILLVFYISLSISATDYIYWADSDHGTINRIKRDGTGRQLLIEQTESIENVPIDWLTGKFKIII